MVSIYLNLFDTFPQIKNTCFTCSIFFLVNVQIVVFLLLMLVTVIVVDAAVVKNFNKVFDLQPGQQNQRGFGIRILSLIVSKSVLCK